jgi:outer membrane protein insertion porin family
LLSVFEGERYSFSSINLVSDKSVFPDDKTYFDFNDILSSSLKEGDFFSRQKLIDVRIKMKTFLLKKGFLTSEVFFNVLNLGDSKIQIDFVCANFVKSRVKHINFVGNFLTCDRVLRRMIPAMEGSGLSIDDIEFAREEIMRTGIADFVNVDFVKNPDDLHEMNIVYSLDEQKFGKLGAGLSYSSDEGLNVNLNTELTNFLGTGTDLILDVNHNSFESDFSFTYYTPYFFDEKFGVGYRFYYRSDFFEQDVDNFNVLAETFGAHIYYSFDLNKFKKFIFGFGCDMTFLGSYDENISNEIRIFVDRFGCDFKDYYFSLAWTYNSLDKFFYPTSGLFSSVNFRLNLPGSKSKYYILSYDLNYYNTFYNDCSLNVFGSLYYGSVYGINELYPFFKNFHIRNPNNIRGFKDRTLGPKDSNEDNIGGNLLFCVKVSFYLPSFLLSEIRDVKTALFFDIGNVYNTKLSGKKNFKKKISYYFDSLKFSFGFALLWNTPFGVPLEFSIAYPFNVDDDDTRSIFSVSLG